MVRVILILAFAVVILLIIVFLLLFKKETPPSDAVDRHPCHPLDEDPIYLQRVEAKMIRELREEAERREDRVARENIYSDCP